WFATAICGNDILSSTFYVSGIAIIFAGVYAPLVMAFIGLVLFFYKAVYTEVVEALPINGGAYNCLLNATSKSVASLAGVTTILSYVATAVISGKTAVEYLDAIIKVPVTILTIGLLGFFAVLVIMGLKDSAKVALTIFVFHIISLIAFLILGAFYILHGGHNYLLANLAQTTKTLTPNSSGLLKALFFGFAASMLGVSGFESSANFVEEQQKGVFRKTLRNMLITVAVFNPLIALIILNVMPIDAIAAAKDFILADAAHIFAGHIFEVVLVADAFLVLAGAVLTGFVGVSGLIYRMASDAVLPNFFTKENSKGSYPRIVIAFFVLCTSILLVTGGDLLALAGVYTIAFLTVMSLFALGNLILRETRSELKRTYHAPVVFVVLALLSTVLGIIGNINLEPKNLTYFATYFIPAVILIFIFANMDLIIKNLMRVTRKIPFIYNFLERNFDDMHEGRFLAFVHHIDRLHSILDYVNKNETGWNITLVHSACEEHKNDVGKGAKEVQEVINTLQKAGVFPHLRVNVVFEDKPFGPELIEEVSKKFKVRKNRILIGSIHNFHPFDYADLGGVRIIF
ncbi:MAG TPA: APC family permease, partial [Patescibacteria group bacterium]